MSYVCIITIFIIKLSSLLLGISSLCYIMASIPSQRYNKPNWLILHNNHCLLAKNSNATTLLIGDSIIACLNRYPNVWNKYFGNNSVNFGIRGDCVQNVLWRSINFPILS